MHHRRLRLGALENDLPLAGRVRHSRNRRDLDGPGIGLDCDRTEIDACVDRIWAVLPCNSRGNVGTGMAV